MPTWRTLLRPESCFESVNPKHSKRTPLLAGLFMQNLPGSGLLLRWGITSLPGCRQCHRARYNINLVNYLTLHCLRQKKKKIIKTNRLTCRRFICPFAWRKCFPSLSSRLLWNENHFTGQFRTLHILLYKLMLTELGRQAKRLCFAWQWNKCEICWNHAYSVANLELSDRYRKSCD